MISLEETASAVGVGVVNIATRTVDSGKPYTPFRSTTDLTRTLLTVGSLVGNMVVKGKQMQDLTRAVFVASEPLFLVSLYNAAKVSLFKGVPLSIGDQSPTTVSIDALQRVGAQESLTRVLSGSQGIPEVNSGGFDGGNGAYF